MKRWLVVLLVALAVLVLVAPGIIGRLAEQNLGENLEWMAAESGGIEIRTESFERGWFTSEGRHRVVLSSVSLRDAAEGYRQANGYDELPSLIIDTSIDHGPVPGGSMTPGLARTVSTFQFDPGNGELAPLPGSLYSNVGLTGTSESQFLMEAGRYEDGNGTVEWSGADIAIEANPSNGMLVIDGSIEPVMVDTGSDLVRIGAVGIASEHVRGGYGFNEGEVSITIDSFEVPGQGNAVSIGEIAFQADLAIEDTRLNAGSTISLADMVLPMVGETSVVLDIAMNGLDAAATRIIVQAMEDAGDQPNPDAAMANLLPQIEDELRTLVNTGAEVRIDQFDVALEQGTLEANLSVTVPEGDQDADFNWSSVLLAMSASADVRIPQELFEFVTAMNPQATSLLAMGFLVPDGEDYVMNAEYSQGLVNINGAPMPIPIPGM